MTGLPSSRARAWELKTVTIEFDRWPKIMGIVNVTPDSFSDGGSFRTPDAAIQHALTLDEQGAEILDVGGESTRPYSEPVSEQEELERVVPVVEGIVKRTETPVSIDTSKAAVAKACLASGAEIINDVTGLEGDTEMLPVAIQTGAGICVMHMQGTPQTMQDNPAYENVTSEIFLYLKQRLDFLIAGGVSLKKICLDPGIGFGKTHEHNFQLIKECSRFLDLGSPVLVGHSRKGFIGKAIGDKLRDRDAGTLAISLKLAQSGMHVIRVHNVQATFDALKLWSKTNP